MKVIIAGSRGITNIDLVFSILNSLDSDRGLFSLLDITEVVSGTANGIDHLGEQWAKFWNRPITRFPADWNKHGKKAGYLRNKEMVDYADALIAIWDGESKGTKHTIDLAFKKGIPVFLFTVRV